MPSLDTKRKITDEEAKAILHAVAHADLHAPAHSHQRTASHERATKKQPWVIIDGDDFWKVLGADGGALKQAFTDALNDPDNTGSEYAPKKMPRDIFLEIFSPSKLTSNAVITVKTDKQGRQYADSIQFRTRDLELMAGKVPLASGKLER